MFVFIALGGALGAVSRYAVSLMVVASFGQAMQPMATLAVNVIGSGIMGLAYALIGLGVSISDPMRGFIMIGFLGALTTFSSFSLDAISLIEKGSVTSGLLYIISSVMVSLLAFVAVMALTRHFVAGH